MTVPPDPMSALLEPDAFREHPLVEFTAAQMPIMAGLTFAQAEIPSAADDDLPPWWTWFGGNPLVRRDADLAWPRNRDGLPLMHVLQVDLEAERLNLREELFARTGLPSGGIFQLFHDLETYGNAEDRDADAWKVRWIERNHRNDEQEDFVFQSAPQQTSSAAEEVTCEPMERVLLNTAIVATIPPLLDVVSRLSAAEGDRYERVHEWLEMGTEQLNLLGPEQGVEEDSTPWDEDFEPQPAPSRMGGFGIVEHNPDTRRELETALPIADGDGHVLLAELNPAQFDTPVDWLHGLRPLQLWIRESDLAVKRFDDVWCQIRTDA